MMDKYLVSKLIYYPFNMTPEMNLYASLKNNFYLE